MLSTRHVAALRSNAAPPRERLRESPFFQRRVRRERECLRPIAPIVTGAGESPTFKFDIAHHVPGRMRIRAAALKGNVCASEDARCPREPVYIAKGEFARGSTGGRKIWRGTDGSNPSPSSDESRANLKTTAAFPAQRQTGSGPFCGEPIWPGAPHKAPQLATIAPRHCW